MDFGLPTSRIPATAWNPSKLEGAGLRYPFEARPPSRDVSFRWRMELECENPECSFRNPMRRFFHRRASGGVRLQGHWYCSLDCFEQVIGNVFSGMLQTPDEPLRRAHRVPIGLLLLGRGVISENELKSALSLQRQSANERLGRALIRLGLASASDISAALAAQWGCAVFPLEQDQRYRSCAHMLPFALLDTARMLPVHYLSSNHLLFVGFSDDVDHTALYSIEQLLGSRTEPCVVSESAMTEALEEMRSQSRPAEIVFETVWNSPQIARTIRDYAVKLGADELLLARPRKFLWVRLRTAGDSLDLLFRLPPEKVI